MPKSQIAFRRVLTHVKQLEHNENVPPHEVGKLSSYSKANTCTVRE